jgi:hypothetical protein
LPVTKLSRRQIDSDRQHKEKECQNQVKRGNIDIQALSLIEVID